MNAVTEQKRNVFELLDDPKVKSGIASVAGRYMTPDRMLRLCVFAVKRTPDLLKCDPYTVLGAMMTSAVLGLEPNTVQQQAFLIPYKKNKKVGKAWVENYECQFQVGARGYITLAYRSPLIKSIFAETVHANDLFEHMQGSETFLRFRKSLDERGDPTCSFSHVRYADGTESMCVLPMSEIRRIRDKSETWKSLTDKAKKATGDDAKYAAKKLAETPWVAWFDDMGAKSAIKKHAKQLPLTHAEALQQAATIDSLADIGKLDFGAMADPDMANAVADGMDPPVLEHDPSDVADFGATGSVVDDREPVRSALPPMPDDRFANQSRGLLAAIQAGNQTPDGAIALLSSKFSLSPEQLATFKERA